MGGFADVALRRGARIGDGFIFAHGAADAFVQRERLRELLAENGRADAPFELRINMMNAKTPEVAADTAKRWQDAGGTHAAVSTMGLGFTTADQHVAYLAEVRSAIA